MRKRGKQVVAALLAALVFSGQISGGFLGSAPSSVYAAERSATINGDIVNVRSGPGTGNSVVARLTYGTAVTVYGEATASDGVLWYQIRFTTGTLSGEGYASSQYIKFPVAYSTDANFEAYLNDQRFPESYKDSLRTLHAEHPSWVFQAQHTGIDWDEAIDNESKVGANLVDKGSISSWKSTEYGAYDWNTGVWTGFDGATWVAASREIVSYYMDPRNFLNDTYVFQFLLHTYDSNSQTRDALQGMIAGTFLSGSPTESKDSGSRVDSSYGPGSSDGPGTSPQNIGPGYESYGPGFEGVTQTVSETAAEQETQQSAQDVSLEGPVAPDGSGVSAGTIQAAALAAGENYGPGMSGDSISDPGSNGNGPVDSSNGSQAPIPQGQSYADIIMNAASQSGVNPYVLAAMILQEQGQGTSRSISGTASGYEGYYNFFNVGAYASDSMDAVTRGLWYASQSGSYMRPWNSIERSIVGGAVYYGETFVREGQDTFYLKKFNVQGSNLYKHQYMTNIQAAASEAAKMEDAYTDAMKGQTLVFKIPIFNDMPATACAKPTKSGSPNNKLTSLSVEGYALTPTFSMDTESYDVIVNPSVDRIAVSAVTADSSASVSGTGTVNLQSGSNVVSVEVRAENGDVRTYRLNIVRQSDAPVVNVSDQQASPAPQTNGNENVGNTNNNGTGQSPISPGMTGGPGSAGAQSSSQDSGANQNGSQAGPGQTAGQQSQSSDVQVGVAPV